MFKTTIFLLIVTLLTACESNNKPKLIKSSLPLYPARAFIERTEGVVKVMFDIDANGTTQNIRIIESIPEGVFDREVKIAMDKSHFESGKPTQNIVKTVYFKLKKPQD